MRRSSWAFLPVVLVLLLFGSFGWLTNHPDAEILAQAESWPLVGPLASHFRAAYRGPERTLPEPEPMEDLDVVVTRQVTYEQNVWVLKGLELKARPEASAATIHRFEQISTAGKIERRGDWYHVDFHGLTGWVYLENYDEAAEVPYGVDSDPPLPLPARDPDPDRLEAARKYLRGREREIYLSSYTLYTDSQDDDLLAHLDAVVESLDEVYTARYGHRPRGEAAEAIVLYQSDIAYRLLQRQNKKLAGLASAGHNSHGVAVLYVGGRSRAAVAETLVHELVHFLNRRAVGPHLPAWLDEGLADDLAQAKVDEAGRLVPHELGGERKQQGKEIRFTGGLASVWALRDAARNGSLPALTTLIGTEWESFVESPGVQLNYATAAFWVRFLLDADGARHSAAFREFLGEVASGGPPSEEALSQKLGEDWGALEARFEAWVEQQAAKAEVPDDLEAPDAVE